MVNTEIEKIVESEKFLTKAVQICFKQRNSITAHFVKADDYDELKRKNFWRVIMPNNVELWKKTKSVNLTRLFNGTEFSKLK